MANRGATLRHSQLIDSLLCDGLWDPFRGLEHGQCSRVHRAEYEVSRQAMDEFALASHRKLSTPSMQVVFRKRLCRWRFRGARARLPSSTDETPRRETSLEALAKLKPAFEKDGKVTAGNAPGLNDGAARWSSPARRKRRCWAENHWRGLSAMPRPAVEQNTYSSPRIYHPKAVKADRLAPGGRRPD